MIDLMVSKVLLFSLVGSYNTRQWSEKRSQIVLGGGVLMVADGLLLLLLCGAGTSGVGLLLAGTIGVGLLVRIWGRLGLMRHVSFIVSMSSYDGINNNDPEPRTMRVMLIIKVPSAVHMAVLVRFV